MYGAIEGVVLCEDEEDDEGHVHMMRVSLLYMIQDLQNGQHLHTRKRETTESQFMGVCVYGSVCVHVCVVQLFWLQ